MPGYEAGSGLAGAACSTAGGSGAANEELSEHVVALCSLYSLAVFVHALLSSAIFTCSAFSLDSGEST